jgi:hypothetical protein
MTARAHDPHIGLVVEGPGDEKAVPVLLRKLHGRQDCYCDCLAAPVVLKGVSNALKQPGIEGYARAAANRSGAVGVLILVDSDGASNPSAYAEELRVRAQGVTPKPVLVALADPDFEQWLYSSAETLNIGLSAYQPGVRGKNEIVTALKPQAYTKPIWQPKLAARVDLDLAMNRSADLQALEAHFRTLHGLLP